MDEPVNETTVTFRNVHSKRSYLSVAEDIAEVDFSTLSKKVSWHQKLYQLFAQSDCRKIWFLVTVASK